MVREWSDGVHEMRWILLVLAGTVLTADGNDDVLSLPKAVQEEPAAGRRVIVQTPEYAGTNVRHTLYLPPDWNANWPSQARRWPVIVEYTGNRYPAAGSTGEVEDAGLGYGISGGRFIWLVLPYVSEDHSTNAVTWWGDVEATVDYAKSVVPQVCDTYGGDPDSVLICGFSRGAIGVNFIGLHDDEIAKMWAGFVSHDHYDGQREWRNTSWGSPLEQYRRDAEQRLKRLNGRPVLVCQNGSTDNIRQYLEPRTSLDRFTFLGVDVPRILGEFPNETAIHPHNDRWLLKPSGERQQVWKWIDAVVGERQ